MEVGELDPAVNESSGMAISRRIPNRSYRINDSGDSGRFFVMDLTGRLIQIVTISRFNPFDTEDMSIGPCGTSSDCLFIGDIGDNGRRREFVDLVVIEERADFPSEVRPVHRVRLRMVTGMNIAPNGKSFLLLNYGDAMEFFVDLSADKLEAEKWKAGTDYRVLELITLEQEESVAYLPNGQSLLYDTERREGTRARIMRMDCK